MQRRRYDVQPLAAQPHHTLDHDQLIKNLLYPFSDYRGLSGPTIEAYANDKGHWRRFVEPALKELINAWAEQTKVEYEGSLQTLNSVARTATAPAHQKFLLWMLKSHEFIDFFELVRLRNEQVPAAKKTLLYDIQVMATFLPAPAGRKHSQVEISVMKKSEKRVLTIKMNKEARKYLFFVQPARIGFGRR